MEYEDRQTEAKHKGPFAVGLKSLSIFVSLGDKEQSRAQTQGSIMGGINIVILSMRESNLLAPLRGNSPPLNPLDHHA